MSKQKNKQDDKSSLKDRLGADVLNKLAMKKSSLKEAEQQAVELANKRKIEERKQREKNKSFEELLEESNLDWQKFK
ncbi:YqkE family protein [Radiobacillus sp. PE A8.2]|uniref:YqkE family protein n=1 Tax=Radiobacillus sp. PE A8.2 TaxID=3380349 RepID=UPI00388E6319